MTIDRDLRSGSTTILILALLQEEPMYGYQIVKELERRSGGYFQFKEGTLYPALHRLEHDGYVEAIWREAESGPRRKYYTLTEKGKGEVARSADAWRTFSQKLLDILGGDESAPEGA